MTTQRQKTLLELFKLAAIVCEAHPSLSVLVTVNDQGNVSLTFGDNEETTIKVIAYIDGLYDGLEPPCPEFLGRSAKDTFTQLTQQGYFDLLDES